MTTETYEQTFTISGIPTVKVGNIRGKIEVSPGESGQVHVTAVKHGNSSNLDRTEIKMFQNEEGHVIVETKYPHNGLRWLGFIHRPARVDFTIVVPQECNLFANSVSGEAYVYGIEGDIKINSVSGAMKVEDLQGKLKLNTVSGKVVGKRLFGPLTLDSVSGRVILSESDLPALKANTVSGNLTLETPLGEGPYRVNSVSGTLTLIVPDGSSCSATVSSVSGRIQTNLPQVESLKNGGPGKRRHYIRIGEGGPEIKLSSVSGILRLVNSEENSLLDTPRSTSSTSSPSNKPTQMDILERIARGELSVDDGLVALKAS